MTAHWNNYHLLISNALQNKQFLKLIMGASFTDAENLKNLVLSYVNSGINCIDMTTDTSLIETVAHVLKENNINHIALMTSISIDDDPHFRKIKLERNQCIDCGACINACPTSVFSMPENTLAVDTPKCYGCDRCVPVCPTEALLLEPFLTQQNWIEALKHPMVSAVEIHSEHVDATMVPDFWNELGDLLNDKMISLCFRPQHHDIEKIILFIEAFQKRSPYPLIIQVDGQPMSATDAVLSSQSAIDAAIAFYHRCQGSRLEPFYLTISGGINQHTPSLLTALIDNPIQGIGIGTTARRWVWSAIENNNMSLAQQQAKDLITLFLEDMREKPDKKGYNTHVSLQEGQIYQYAIR